MTDEQERLLVDSLPDQQKLMLGMIVNGFGLDDMSRALDLDLPQTKIVRDRLYAALSVSSSTEAFRIAVVANLI